MNKLTTGNGQKCVSKSKNEVLSIFTIRHTTFCLYQKVVEGGRIESTIYSVAADFVCTFESFYTFKNANPTFVFQISLNNLGDYTASLKGFNTYTEYKAFCENNNTVPATQDQFNYFDSIDGGIKQLCNHIAAALDDDMLDHFAEQQPPTKNPMLSKPKLPPFIELVEQFRGLKNEDPERHEVLKLMQGHLAVSPEQITYDTLKNVDEEFLFTAIMWQAPPLLTAAEIMEICKTRKSNKLRLAAVSSHKLNKQEEEELFAIEMK